MDFPRSCSSGVLAIVGHGALSFEYYAYHAKDGFSLVPFRVYSVPRTTGVFADAVDGEDGATADDRDYEALIKVEGDLRREGFFVTAKPIEMQLWVFLLSTAQSDRLRPDAKGELLIGDARVQGI